MHQAVFTWCSASSWIAV